MDRRGRCRVRPHRLAERALRTIYPFIDVTRLITVIHAIAAASLVHERPLATIVLHRMMGITLGRLGFLDEAESAFYRAAAAADADTKACSLTGGPGIDRSNIASIYAIRGELDRASAILETTIPMLVANGEVLPSAMTWAELELDRGRPDRAAVRLALTVDFEQLRFNALTMDLTIMHARVALASGREDEAETLLRSAEDQCRAAGNREGLSEVFSFSATALMLSGRVDEAATVAGEALELASALRLPRSEALANGICARIALAGSNPRRALAHAESAVEAARRGSLRKLELEAETLRAAALWAAGNRVDAMRVATSTATQAKRAGYLAVAEEGHAVCRDALGGLSPTG